MLVLTRELGESIKIGQDVEVTVVKISDGRVKLAITAPCDVQVDRLEVAERREAEGREFC